MAVEQLKSNMWSAETLLRGVRAVDNQPLVELLATGDPEVLEQLKACHSLRHSVWTVNPGSWCSLLFLKGCISLLVVLSMGLGSLGKVLVALVGKFPNYVSSSYRYC